MQYTFNVNDVCINPELIVSERGFDKIEIAEWNGKFGYGLSISSDNGECGIGIPLMKYDCQYDNRRDAINAAVKCCRKHIATSKESYTIVAELCDKAFNESNQLSLF